MKYFPKLIAIHAPARQSGKTTVADVLINGYDYKLAKMAGGIYAMWCALLDYAQVPPEIKRRATYGDLKETPLAQVAGASFRTFAEGPGHYCRMALGKAFWADIGRIHVSSRLAKGEYLVVDDLRMENEADMLLSLGAVIFSVSRPEANGGQKPSLPSEIDSPPRPEQINHNFRNDGTVEQLRMKVHQWIGSLPPSR